VLVVTGCATSGDDIVNPPLLRRISSLPANSKKILVMKFEGKRAECFTNEAQDYLRTARFEIVGAPDMASPRELEGIVERNDVDLVLTGRVEKLQAKSDTATRNAWVGYNTAFVVMAPFAGAYAATTPWLGFAAAEARMTITDAR